MTEQIKQFTIKKEIPGDLYLTLFPIDNSSAIKLYKLTKNQPEIRVPRSYALSVFSDASLLDLYNKGLFSFTNIEGLLKEAINEEIIAEDEVLVNPNAGLTANDILQALKSGKRTEIINMISKRKELTLQIARDNIEILTAGVISIIEKETNVQLRIDGE